MAKIRIIFILFLLSLFLEGVVRKWIMPSLPSMIAFAIKYILLLIIAFYLNREKHNILPDRVSKLFKYYIIIITFWAFIVGMFYNGPIVASIATVQYCAPIAIAYSIPYLYYNQNQLNSFLKLLAIIAIPVFIIAFIQYFSPPTALINRYGVEESKYIAMVGSNVRVTSVFSYITPFGDCCIFLCVFSLCLIIRLKEYKGIVQFLILLLFVFSIIGGFMSGARMVVGLIGIYTLLISLILTREGNFKFIGLIGLIVITFLYLYFEYGFEFVDNFLYRVDSASDDTGGRIGKMLSYEKMFGYGGFLGFGAGFTSNALQPLLSFKSPVYFEEELGRIILEFGAFGGIAIIIIRLLLLKYVYENYKSTENLKLKNISLACLLAITPMSIFLQLCLYNWFSYMCYYIFIGISFAVKNMDTMDYENED